MRITSENDETGAPETVLRDVFSGVKFVTEEGNCLGVCMRDDGYEISVFSESKQATSTMKNPVWFKVDPYKQTIQCVNPPAEKPDSTAGFNIIGLHCLAPRKLQLVQEHELAQSQYRFLLSEQEHTLLQTQFGYFVVEKSEHETRDELFAYTLDHGRSFITTDSMSEVLYEFKAICIKRERSFLTAVCGQAARHADQPSMCAVEKVASSNSADDTTVMNPGDSEPESSAVSAKLDPIVFELERAPRCYYNYNPASGRRPCTIDFERQHTADTFKKTGLPSCPFRDACFTRSDCLHITSSATTESEGAEQVAKELRQLDWRVTKLTNENTQTLRPYL